MPYVRPRIYIAGPMTGLPEFNYPAFHAAAAAWRACGWDAVNPADNFGGDQTRTYREYVESDLAVLITCHAIAMLPGWDAPDARGSVWEEAVARTLLRMPVYDATDPQMTIAMQHHGPRDLVEKWARNRVPLNHACVPGPRGCVVCAEERRVRGEP